VQQVQKRQLLTALRPLVMAYLALSVARPAFAADAPPDTVPTDLQDPASAGHRSLEEACPHAFEASRAAAAQLHRRQPAIARVTRPALQHELLTLAQIDSDARDRWDLSQSEPVEVVAADQHNLIRLKQILHQEGFPTAKMVGYIGVAAAWLLLQHADIDPAFQRHWLPVIGARARTGDLSYQFLGLFTDRVLLASGHKQRYGTQIMIERGQFIIRPTEDPQHLDRRRKALEMVPEEDYLCTVHFMTPMAPSN